MDAIELKQAESQKIRDEVWSWFQENPCHTKAECAAALGYNRATIGKHCKAIREGWRPSTAEAQRG